MKEILMIDNKNSAWLPGFEDSASQLDFIITTAPGIEEGLEKLRDFPECIKSIILGLSFSEEYMKGIEGLLRFKKIKKTYQNSFSRSDSYSFQTF